MIACINGHRNNTFIEEFCQEFLFVHNNNKIIMVIRSRNSSRILTLSMQSICFGALYPLDLTLVMVFDFKTLFIHIFPSILLLKEIKITAMF